MCFGAYTPLPSAASAHLPCHLLSLRQGSSHLPAAKPTASGPLPCACIHPPAPSSLVPSPPNHVEPSPSSYLPPLPIQQLPPSSGFAPQLHPFSSQLLAITPNLGGPLPNSSSFSSPTPQFLPETYHQPQLKCWLFPAPPSSLPCGQLLELLPSPRFPWDPRVLLAPGTSHIAAISPVDALLCASFVHTHQA